MELEELLARYDAAGGTRRSRPSATTTATREFDRDPLVVAIGKVRAGFKCEVPSCSHPSFMDAGSLPYCEVHHIRPLAEGGDDVLENVACLCPAHHREVHYGKAAETLQAELIDLRTASNGRIEQISGEALI